jgi:DNA-binding transcriptional ArsR family regulator
MAKLSELVSRSSEATGVAIATVREVSRRLREAGLIHTGKGGRYGGADMMPQDVAALLTGLMVARVAASLNDVAKHTTVHLQDLRAYHGNERLHLARWDRRLALPQLCNLRAGHSFGEAFTALVASISNGELEDRVAKWSSARLPGSKAHFGLSVELLSPPPIRDARIIFQSSAFSTRMVYLLPRDAKNTIIPSVPRGWSDIADGPPDLFVTVSLQETALKAASLVLRESETRHG